MTTARKPKPAWSNRDHARAQAEGWDIFYVYGDELREIEADNDSPRFKSDEAAMEHVYKRALAGSRLHIRALVIHSQDAVEVLHAAFGYGRDELIPEKVQGRSVNSGDRYSHQFSLEYTIKSGDIDANNVAAIDHYNAIEARARAIVKACERDDIREVVGLPESTTENKEGAT